MIHPDHSIRKELADQRPRTPVGLLSRAEKDRIIERGVHGLYRWYLARSQSKRNWNPDTFVRWPDMRKDHSPELMKIIEGFYAIEQYAPDYTAVTLRMNRKNYGRAQFQLRWGSEEEKHSDLWLNALLFSGQRSPEWVHEYKKSLREREWDTPWTDVIHGTFYVVFQERATQLNYLNTAIIAAGKSTNPAHANDADPVLLEAAKTIAVDEAAHYSFFLEIGRLLMYYYPAESIEAIWDIITHFSMPAIDLIPNSEHIWKQFNDSDVFTPRQFMGDVVATALSHLGWESRKALARGIKNNRLVPDEDGNLYSSAIFDEFGYDSIEKAVRKLHDKINDYERLMGLYAIDPTVFVPSGMPVREDVEEVENTSTEN
ncbi:MAG: fatty acid desaturase [Phototrophicales bacterium]|nr:MAG: fatty acid desaturase [Phototrophicales bacterium]